MTDIQIGDKLHLEFYVVNSGTAFLQVASALSSGDSISIRRDSFQIVEHIPVSIAIGDRVRSKSDHSAHGLVIGVYRCRAWVHWDRLSVPTSPMLDGIERI